MAENIQDENIEKINDVETIEETKEVSNDASLLSKIKSMLGVNPTNEHEDGHEKEEADVADWQGMETRIENLEKAVHELEVAMGLKDEEIENKSKELETANEEIKNQAVEISKLKAVKTDVKPNNDPNVIENAVVDPNMAFFNAMVKTLKRKA